MYILKNALISITRNKGRNILVGIIITVIAASCAITLAIRNSAIKIVNSYEEKYDVEATIGMDRNALMESLRDGSKTQEDMINAFNKIKAVTVEDIKNYGESEYVKKYYYTYETSTNAKDIKELTDSLVKETTKTETSTQTFPAPPKDGGGRPDNKGGYSGTKKTTKKTTIVEKIFNERAQSGAFSIKGFSSVESMSDFINGKSTITSGAIFTDFEETDDGYYSIISEELATLNKLEVGSTITLVSPNNTKKTYKIVISGIYKEADETANDMRNMFTSSANTIIVSSKLIEKMMSDDSDLKVTVTPTFILKNKDIASNFATEVKEKGLSEYYTVTDNVSVVEEATKSITNVKNFATTFLIITLIIGGVVLFVLNMINIRERKYEIGVLRTIGMKKSLVITQFMLELLMVAIVALLLGAIAGASTSVNVANNLLETEINNAQNEREQIDKNFGGKNDGKINNGRPSYDLNKINFGSINGLVDIEEIDNIEAIVDIKVLGQLLGIGVLLTIVSSLSAGIAIARFQPLTILKERS